MSIEWRKVDSDHELIGMLVVAGPDFARRVLHELAGAVEFGHGERTLRDSLEDAWFSVSKFLDDNELPWH